MFQAIQLAGPRGIFVVGDRPGLEGLIAQRDEIADLFGKNVVGEAMKRSSPPERRAALPGEIAVKLAAAVAPMMGIEEMAPNLTEERAIGTSTTNVSQSGSATDITPPDGDPPHLSQRG